MSFANQSRRSALSLMVLGVCAVTSIATSPPEHGWAVGDSTGEEAFTLSEEAPVFAGAFDVAITAETLDGKRQTTRELTVDFDLTSLRLTDQERRPRVRMTLSDADGEVLDEQTLRASDLDSEWGNWASLNGSQVLEDCEPTADCLAELDVTVELVGGGEVYGTWNAFANVSVFHDEPLPTPNGALVEVTRLEAE